MATKQGMTDTGLAAETVESFKATLRGALLRPGDNGYDEARKIWNAMIDKRPALIARCAGIADVINAVNFARTHDLLVAVRGGGHNVAGNAVCDGGLMIDLSPMKSVYVNPVQRTARAEPGVTWREFDHETQAFGLATTGGVIPTTGVAGLTLGGGIGWLMGQYGLSCDNLLSVDIVTADGHLRQASAAENADLFWGVRGGGGNFGIVTSFEYRLHAVNQVLGGMVIHPVERARDVLKFYREFTRTAPDALTSMAAFLTSPDGAPVLALVVCYNGPLAEGDKVLQPLRAFGPPVADHIGPMAYTALQSMLEAGFPPGLQNYWKSNFLKDLSDDAVAVMVDRFMQMPAPTSALVIEHIGGAVSRVGEDATAFTHRHAPYNLLIVGIWPNPADNHTNIRWVRQTWDAMQPFSSGAVYVNYLGQTADEGAERIKEAYGVTKYERLLTLKKKYDPMNLFRLNQNINPLL
jgi:FAD/FMN-containing dehydrogenase